MPRPVVPIFAPPRASSCALSNAICQGMMRCAALDTRTRDTSTPRMARPSSSSTSRAVSEPGKVLIGISISREKTKTHHPQAETLAAGLDGVAAGLNSPRGNPSAIQGVAIYAQWEATPEDWRIWQERWISYHR